jgi:hypothetical protein
MMFIALPGIKKMLFYYVVGSDVASFFCWYDACQRL